MEEMQERAASGKSDRNLARMWASHTHDLEVDRQGRIVLPARMREYAGLESDVTVVGCDRQGGALGPGALADEYRARGTAVHRGCGRLSVETQEDDRRDTTRDKEGDEERTVESDSTRYEHQEHAQPLGWFGGRLLLRPLPTESQEQPSRRHPPVEGLRMRQVFTHEPVMVDEVVALFAPVPPGVVIDATAGGGGHAAALLAAHPHLRLLCLDRDPDAVEATTLRLEEYGDRADVRRARFDRLGEVAEAMGIGPGTASGVLFDLGVSSPQLDRPERGFSYRADAPLDMRMDPDEETTAVGPREHLARGRAGAPVRGQRRRAFRPADRARRRCRPAPSRPQVGSPTSSARRCPPPCADKAGTRPAASSRRCGWR